MQHLELPEKKLIFSSKLIMPIYINFVTHDESDKNTNIIALMYT
jgi:hypothetical protein